MDADCGRMLVKSWSSTQATVGTSKGEAEYNALVRGAAEALGLKAVLDELCRRMPIDIMIESAAAKSILLPAGTGKAAAHGGEAVVGAESGLTKAAPHHQSSWNHKPRGHPDKAQSLSTTLVLGLLVSASASQSTGRSDQTQVLPRTVVRTCSRRPNPAGQAVGLGCWSDMSLVQSQCLMLLTGQRLRWPFWLKCIWHSDDSYNAKGQTLHLTHVHEHVSC